MFQELLNASTNELGYRTIYPTVIELPETFPRPSHSRLKVLRIALTSFKIRTLPDFTLLEL